MNGADLYSLRSLERTADFYGFRVDTSASEYKNIVLVPKDEDSLPCFARDAEFGYNGTLEGTTGFLHGWGKCLMYMQSLKLADSKKIAKAEDLIRQNQTLKALKEDK